MTGNHRLRSVLAPGPADPGSLATMIDASLRRRSSLSIALSDATVGVTVDKLGDWTIVVGLSLRSDRFQQATSSLEGLGFFQAAENGGATYMLWTSLFSEAGNVRATAEQTLLRVLKLLHASPASPYIS